MKRTGATLMLGIMMPMLILSGCVKDESKKVNKSAETSVSDNTEDTAEESSGNIEGNADAIDQIVNHIEVNGKHVDFPFTLNDLGDDYDFAYYVDMGDGKYGMDLQYNGEKIANVYVYESDIKNINRNSNIFAFSISRFDKKIISVYGIDCDSSFEDAQLSFSDLKVNYRDDETPSSIDYLDDRYLFSLYFSDEKSISGIDLKKKGEQRLWQSLMQMIYVNILRREQNQMRLVQQQILWLGKKIL